jgi:lipid-A-disaccharide synthase
LVVILPGSRTQEVSHNLKWFLKAAALIHEKVPDVRFALASFKPHQAEIARQMIADVARRGQSHFRGEEVDSQGDADAAAKIGTVPSGLPIEICVGKTPELMRLADCAMSVSGSVSLELLYHTTPTVVLYWVNRFAYFVQGFFRKVKYITLVNLLANGGLEEECRDLEDARRGLGTSVPSAVGSEEGSGFRVQDSVLFPEYLTCEDKSAQIAGHVIQWLTDPAKRAARVEALARLKEEVAHGGASSRAAAYILAALAQRPRCVPRPHFRPLAVGGR